MTDSNRIKAQAMLCFGELLELSSDEEMAARLRDLRASDPELAHEVEQLLACDSEASGMLDRGLREFVPTLVQDLDLDGSAVNETRAGTRIGHFVLREALGCGGMGEVWLAERRDGDLLQTAALKLIRHGFDSTEMLARFRQERRILAGLEHPGIARFIEGGLTEDGRPYYVMEYVEGVPVTVYARENRLSVRERVELMLAICDAVAYAQQRLVVHRDLKPGNVLVDRTGRVRLLDFGIAKLLTADADAHATATGVRAMSPAYAAPEQFLDQTISTATDVYSLGVLLYELLTGELPHRRKSASLAEIAQSLQRETTQRPSAALRRHSGNVPDDPLVQPRYRHALNRDLDLIALKALRGEPERRYPTAAALGADLQRWLDGRAVEAAGDSTRYRLGKFVRRFKLEIGSAILILTALGAGLMLAIKQAEIAEAQAQRAALEARRAQQSLDFMAGMFGAADPQSAQHTDSIATALDQGTRQALQGFSDDPLLQGTILLRLAEVQLNRYNSPAAQELLLAAQQRLQGQLPEPDPQSMLMASLFGTWHYRAGNYVESRPWLQRAADEADQLGNRRAQLAALSLLYALPDAADSALPTPLSGQQELLALAERHFGADHPDTAARHVALAVNAENVGEYALAERHLRVAIQIFEKDGDEPRTDLLHAWTVLAGVLDRVGQVTEARMYFAKALPGLRQIYGDDSPGVASALFSEGILLLTEGEPQRAEANFRGVLAMTSPGVMTLAHAERYLGTALRSQQRIDEAIATYARAEQRYRSLQSPITDVQAMRARADQGYARVLGGDPSGIDLLREAVVGIEAIRGERHYDLLQSLIHLGTALIDFERPSEARPVLERARSIAEELLGAEHTMTTRAIEQLQRINATP